MSVIRTAACLLLLGSIAACASIAQPDVVATPSAPASMPVPDTAPAPVPASPPAAPEVIAPAPAKPVAVPAKPRAPAPAPKPVAKTAPKPAAPPRETPIKIAPAGSTVSGRLDLSTGPAGDVTDGLVYFLPAAGGAAPKPGTFSIDTRSKGFSPAVLVVPVGSTVRFPNRDSILHNVFSRSPGDSFDLGYYGAGEVKQRVFGKPGLVIVNCNVHHNMRADIVVLATPYYTRPDHNGRYTLANLPAGPGTLVFWHPRAQPQSLRITLPMATPVSRRLTTTQAIPHAGMEH